MNAYLGVLMIDKCSSFIRLLITTSFTLQAEQLVQRDSIDIKNLYPGFSKMPHSIRNLATSISFKARYRHNVSKIPTLDKSESSQLFSSLKYSLSTLPQSNRQRTHQMLDAHLSNYYPLKKKEREKKK